MELDATNSDYLPNINVIVQYPLDIIKETIRYSMMECFNVDD